MFFKLVKPQARADPFRQVQDGLEFHLTQFFGETKGIVFHLMSSLTETGVVPRSGENRDAVELSVVMPCLNEAATVGVCVKKTIEALERHGIRGEVIVADNGSTDGSQQIAQDMGARVVPVEAARIRQRAAKRHRRGARPVCADGRCR